MGFPADGQIWRLGIMDTRPRRFSGAEVDFVQSIAHVLAAALDRHRTETRLREGTRQLQQALLPVELPVLPGIESAARYVPAGGDQVGGDWYDVLPLPQGRIALVMGDVEGHDQTAAALMGQIRNVLRAYATEGHTPAEILARVNRFVTTHSTRLVTCCYAELQPAERTVTCVTAGHPAPLVLHADGALRPLPVSPGLVLGVQDEQDYLERTTLLPHARALLLVTDGLVDDFAGTLHPGLDALAVATADLTGEPVDVLADRLVFRAPGAVDLRDDAALLAVQLTTPALADTGTVHRMFTNNPSVTRAARTFTHDVLTAWDLPGLHEPAALTISELVTNAVIHTTSPIDVTLRRTGPDRVWIGVHDASDQLPQTPDPTATCQGCLEPTCVEPTCIEPGGRGLLIVGRTADSWGITLTPDRGGKTIWLELTM